MSRVALLALALGGCDLVFELRDPIDAGPDAPAADLAAWYPFDTIESTVIVEGTGRASNAFCATVDCPSEVPGKIGGALRFDGSSKLVQAESAMGLELPNGFTVTAWIHLDQLIVENSGTVYACAVGKRFKGGVDPNLNSWALFLNSSGFVVFQTAIPDGGTGPGGYDDLTFGMDQPVGRWTHIAMRWDGETKSLFIDGGLRGQKASPAVLFDNGELSFGADIEQPSFPNLYFPGAVDDVRVYSRALSDFELAMLGQP